MMTQLFATLLSNCILFILYGVDNSRFSIKPEAVLLANSLYNSDVGICNSFPDPSSLAAKDRISGGKLSLPSERNFKTEIHLTKIYKTIKSRALVMGSWDYLKTERTGAR